MTDVYRQALDEVGAVLPMGSAYEGAMFFLFEIMVAMLKRDLGIGDDAMRARHTNME